MRFPKTVPLLPGIKFVTPLFIFSKREGTFGVALGRLRRLLAVGHACPPARAARGGSAAPLWPSRTGLSWADWGPGSGAFFSLPGTLSRKERGPRRVPWRELHSDGEGRSTAGQAPALSSLRGGCDQGRAARLLLLLSHCTRLLWVISSLLQLHLPATHECHLSPAQVSPSRSRPVYQSGCGTSTLGDAGLWERVQT